MKTSIKLFILLFYVTILTGCFSLNRNIPPNLNTEHQFDFISTKCNLRDEFEIGSPIPIAKKVNFNGTGHCVWSFFQYNVKKNKWKRIKEPKLSLGRNGGGCIFNFHRNYNDNLKSKYIKIIILKKGLFLIKTKLVIQDSSTEEVIYLTDSSTIFDSRYCIDEKNQEYDSKMKKDYRSRSGSGQQ